MGTQQSKARRWIKRRGLLLIVILGGLIIFVFGLHMEIHIFKLRLMTHSERGSEIEPLRLLLTHSESWEVGALLWTLLFVIYYGSTFPFTQNERVDRFLGFLVYFVLPGAIIASFLFLLLWRIHSLHVMFVVFTVTVLMVIDFTFSMYHTGEKKKQFQESVLLADLPVVIAFVILIFYHLLHQHAKGLEVFFGGVISFQLLASNVIFVLIQAGMIKRIYAMEK